MKIALTGAMGCGKSTVLRCFSELGIPTLSADAVCSDILRDEFAELSQLAMMRWGKDVVTSEQTWNRAFISEVVFANPQEKMWWESQLHPRIKQRIQQFFDENSSQISIVEVPLLYEVKWQDAFDKVISVWAPNALIHERITSRNLSLAQIEARQCSQLSADEKLERADWGIINTGSLSQLKAQCEILHANMNDLFNAII